MAYFIEKTENGIKVSDRILGSGNATYILTVGIYVSEHLEKLLHFAPKLDFNGITQIHSDINNNSEMKIHDQTLPEQLVAEAKLVAQEQQLSGTVPAHHQVGII